MNRAVHTGIWAFALNSNGVVHPSGRSTQWAELKALGLTPSHTAESCTHGTIDSKSGVSPLPKRALFSSKKIHQEYSKFYRHHISK